MTTNQATTCTLVHCSVCNAPCHTGHEHITHERACLAILAGQPPDLFSSRPLVDPQALRNYCYRIHCEDQSKAHLRENVPPPNDNMNGLKHLADNQHNHQGWNQQPVPPPPGKTRCAGCNGLVHMHPNCYHCGGVGWIG